MDAPPSRPAADQAVRGAVVSSAWTLVSRLAGYVRDALLASAFGMGPLLGALNLAWLVPNLVRRLFGEGAAAAALLPALARAELDAGQAAAAQDLHARCHGALLRLLGIFTLLGCAALLAAWALLPATPAAADTRRTLLYAAVLLPYVVPIGLAALHAAPQHLRGAFALPALAPVALNLFWIAALLWPLPGDAPPTTRAWCVIFAILLGGVAQWWLQLRGLRAAGFALRPRFGALPPAARGALAGVAPALLGLAAVQVAALVDQIALRLLVDASANSYAYYASRLLHLPLALTGLAVAAGIMPLLAQRAAAGDRVGMGDALGHGLRVTALLAVAAAAGLHAVAEPCARALFERGSFTAEHTATLAATLRAYAPALPFAALGALLARAHLAAGRARFQAWAALWVAPLNFALDFALVPRFGIPGAGYATTLALAGHCALLAHGLRGLGLGGALGTWRALPAMALTASAAWSAARLALRVAGGDAASWRGLGLAVAAGGLAAATLMAWLRPADLRALQRLRRTRPA